MAFQRQGGMAAEKKHAQIIISYFICKICTWFLGPDVDDNVRDDLRALLIVQIVESRIIGNADEPVKRSIWPSLVRPELNGLEKGFLDG